MLTELLFLVFFGIGGNILSINYPITGTIIGGGIGFAISYKLATFIANFLPYEYKMLPSEHEFSPFLYSNQNTLDEETLILNDKDTETVFFRCCGMTQVKKQEDIMSVAFEPRRKKGYGKIGMPVRTSTLGLFADFSNLGLKWSFVLPNATMIKKGKATKVMGRYQLQI